MLVVSSTVTVESSAPMSIDSSVHPRMIACAPAAISAPMIRCSCVRDEDLARGRIGDVQQRNVYGRLDRIGYLVHRVGTQHDTVCTCELERTRGERELSAHRMPIAMAQAALDVVEIDAVEDQPGRVQAAE